MLSFHLVESEEDLHKWGASGSEEISGSLTPRPAQS